MPRTDAEVAYNRGWARAWTLAIIIGIIAVAAIVMAHQRAEWLDAREHLPETLAKLPPEMGGYNTARPYHPAVPDAPPAQTPQRQPTPPGSAALEIATGIPTPPEQMPAAPVTYAPPAAPAAAAAEPDPEAMERDPRFIAFKAAWGQLRKGMTDSEVEALVGPGRRTMVVGDTENYQWTPPADCWGIPCQCWFENGRLTQWAGY